MINGEWAAARRILLVRLDNLGDVLVTSPAIHAVRHSLPEAHLTLLASPVGAQVGRLHPDVDGVIVYRAPWMDPWRQLDQNPARELEIVRTLATGEYDAAIVFTSFRQSPLPAAYLCYLAGIPLRLAASIDGPGSLLTTRHKHPETTMHEVLRGLDLVAAIGIETNEDRLQLSVPAEAQAAATALLAGHRRGTGPAVVLHPGCSMPARTYPWELFAEAADRLATELDATIFLTGSPEERDLTAAIATRMIAPSVDLAGELSFPELCGLIAAADAALTNNTGPMHIAAATGTPVAVTFALTNPPEQWGPWRVPHRLLYSDVPCRICYSRVCPLEHECLRRVTPERVAAEIADLLAAAHLAPTVPQPVGAR